MNVTKVGPTGRYWMRVCQSGRVLAMNVKRWVQQGVLLLRVCQSGREGPLKDQKVCQDGNRGILCQQSGAKWEGIIPKHALFVQGGLFFPLPNTL